MGKRITIGGKYNMYSTFANSLARYGRNVIEVADTYQQNVRKYNI